MARGVTMATRLTRARCALVLALSLLLLPTHGISPLEAARREAALGDKRVTAHRDLALYDAEQCGTAGDARQWAPLWSRLSRGLPITAFAIGSSLVGVHGGCTGPAPIFNTTECRKKCPRCCGSRCGEWGNGGWARELLEWLSRTYPVSPGSSGKHELFNLGEPGGDLIPAMIACPDTYLPKEVHLVLLDLETAPYRKRPNAIEALLRHLLASRGRPTIVLVEFGNVRFIEHIASLASASVLPGGPRERLVAVGRSWNAGALPGGPPAGVPPLESILSTLPKDRVGSIPRKRVPQLGSIQTAYARVKVIHQLRSPYGLPLLSVIGCLGPLMANRDVPVTTRQYGNDGLHPSHLGCTLISGALIAQARRGLAAAAASEITAGGSGEAGALVLPPPRYKALGRVGLACFTFDRESVALSHSARKDISRPKEARARSVMSDKGVLPTIMPSSSGWRFVEYEPQSKTKSVRCCAAAAARCGPVRGHGRQNAPACATNLRSRPTTPTPINPAPLGTSLAWSRPSRARCSRWPSTSPARGSLRSCCSTCAPMSATASPRSAALAGARATRSA
jgi:hypothetical protein